jgi:hypothetical protein
LPSPSAAGRSSNLPVRPHPLPVAKIIPDPVSWTTHHLHMGVMPTDTVLASGTGFIHEENGTAYLITNWHNVAGRDPASGACLSKMLGTPDTIMTYFRDPSQAGSSRREYLKLYRDDAMREPAWYEHPTFGRKVDVVALPLCDQIRSKYRLFPINAIEFDSGFKEEVADDAFVVGYPFADTTYASFPIWKRASLASEPDIDVDHLPKMLIDTATRPGLSGSPVIMQRVGIHDKGPVVTADTIIGRIRNFVGIYSGRIGDDELKAQLGVVWKARVISEIVRAKTFGEIAA